MLKTLFLSKFEVHIVACELGVLAQFGSKKYTINIYKYFELYQSLHAYFSMPKSPDIPIILIAYQKIDIFRSESIDAEID